MQKTINDYGHIWADWLYDKEADAFMAGVYNDCYAIDKCEDPSAKAMKLLSLRDKVNGSNKSWVEGIYDFIDFESKYLTRGEAPLDLLGDGEDYRVLGILHAAYLHGAFRGLCRTPNGAEWIGKLGEVCAAAVHQGFKWLRNGNVSEWELPTVGEAWCKGVAMWGLVCMYIALDIAGEDSANDLLLERIHTVIGAHHYAGVVWMQYRGEHPHKWWNANIPGRAPEEYSIRRFGEKQGWPNEMITVMVRGAHHVNSWTNPSVNPVHFERTRGVLVWDHTPRLKSRIVQVCDELKQVVGDMSNSEAEEFQWRSMNWMATHSAYWRGRDDDFDKCQEISMLGALTGVLRESRPHVMPELVERLVDWSSNRMNHLNEHQKGILLEKVRECLNIRGRVPGAVTGYASAGTDHIRFIDGVWELSSWLGILGSARGGTEIPLNLRELTIRQFHAWCKNRRIVGRDISPGPDESGGCPVCVGDALFMGLVNNRPSTGILQLNILGQLYYNNLGLGTPDDTSLGTKNRLELQPQL